MENQEMGEDPEMSNQAVAEDPEMANQALEEADPFKRLPEDLIISNILSRIPEADSLCKISAVSKHFFRLVLQAQAISVQIPFDLNYLNDFEPGDLNEFQIVFNYMLPHIRKALHHMSRVAFRWAQDIFEPKKRKSRTSSASSSSSLDPAVSLSQICNFLARFESLRSLHWDIIYSKANLLENQPMLRWRVSSDSVMIMHASRPKPAGDDLG